MTYWIFSHPTYLDLHIILYHNMDIIVQHSDVIFIDIFFIIGSLSISLTLGMHLFGHFPFLFLLFPSLSSFIWKEQERKKGLKPKIFS